MRVIGWSHRLLKISKAKKKKKKSHDKEERRIRSQFGRRCCKFTTLGVKKKN